MTMSLEYAREVLASYAVHLRADMVGESAFGLADAIDVVLADSAKLESVIRASTVALDAFKVPRQVVPADVAERDVPAQIVLDLDDRVRHLGNGLARARVDLASDRDKLAAFERGAARAAEVLAAASSPTPPPTVTSRDPVQQAIALFGRGSALAGCPLPFTMINGTPVADPSPGAPRVLCGEPADEGACVLRWGHDGKHDGRRERGPVSVPVVDAREGRAPNDISNVLGSCDPISLVTIKEVALIDEPPWISIGFVFDEQAVKELRERCAARDGADAAVDAAERERVESILALAERVGLGDSWAERMIEAGATVEQARSHARDHLGILPDSEAR